MLTIDGIEYVDVDEAAELLGVKKGIGATQLIICARCGRAMIPRRPGLPHRLQAPATTSSAM